MRQWLAVGRIRRPHGVHGEVVVVCHSDFPERLKAGIELGLGENAPTQFIKVHSVRWHKGAWLLALEGIRSCDEIEPWRGLWVFMPEQDRTELPGNYFYEHELVECSCQLIDGKPLGRVVALIPGGSGTILEVQTEELKVMVPFASPIVVRVDMEAKVIVLDPPRGLFDGDAL